MQSRNKIVIASAGAGKSSYLIKAAYHSTPYRKAVVTYTNANTRELISKARESGQSHNAKVTFLPWYTFLLKHFVRPYQRSNYSKCRIDRMLLVSGSSPYGIAKAREEYYCPAPGLIYSDKVSEFACEVIDKTSGAPIRRFEKCFGELLIDECQDLTAYDLQLIEHLLRSNIKMKLVGDPRQAVLPTNHNRLRKGFKNENIVKQFERWHEAGLCEITYHARSHRCTQSICDFADQFFPELPKTKSLNTESTPHDGVFAVRLQDVARYRDKFQPQCLRFSKKTRNAPSDSINFKISKGRTFYRTLIFPTKKFCDFLAGKLNAQSAGNAPTNYVSITRARQSVAFVVPDSFSECILPIMYSTED
ncbi:hypothetical protein [Thalassospira lucentensis]|uniref:hypothetical protein n=1 Tax=Thalassospira lucentensis TaxID=168935 RepID=UPI003AA915F7|tara:strand:+ start:13086 stop:14171 length:1086 start_codon:yes stop_codon:yes gene_type:complete